MNVANVKMLVVQASAQFDDDDDDDEPPSPE